jgi:two-component system, sensor histidine kinase and response regulator
MSKVLIIEDEEDIRANIQDLLEIHDYEVITAGNGKDGIELVLTTSPDLIICDINMPVMNGLDLIKELRQHPEFYTIPFLFLTANASEDSIRLGMSLGADDYITKPYKGAELIRSVEIRLEKSRNMKELLTTKLDELKKSISFSIPNELSAPLNAIMSFSNLLKGNVSEFKSEEMNGIIDHIHDSGARLLRLVDNYTYFNNLIGGSLTKEILNDSENYSSVDLIQKITDKVASNHYYKNTIILELTENKPVNLAEEYFIKVMYEVLDNAVKFSEPEKPVKIVSVSSGGFYIIKVINSGRGMSKEEITNIDSFMQFGRDSFEQQGLGLGLSIVTKILSVAGGKIQIESVPNDFTAVRIYLPLKLN